MSINFPNAPTTGQLYPQPPVAGVPVYRWDGTKWLIQTAATAVAMRNYIINGAMMVSQENGSTAGTTSGYFIVDQFGSNFSTSGALSVQQVASLTPSGSPNRIRYTVTTAQPSLGATNYACIDHRIEGLRVVDLKFGTLGAKQFTLQFGVRAPAGTYCAIFENAGFGGATRSYVAEYVIAAGEANTDVVKTVTVQGDVTAGNWATNNTAGLVVRFGLASGTNYQQAAGAWGPGDVVGSPNQFNFLGTVGNVFELFDVGLYQGNVAPAFEVPDYASELQKCLRYFESGIANGPTNSDVAFSTGVAATIFFPFYVRKRAVPTCNYFDSTGAVSKFNNSTGLTGTAGQTVTSGGMFAFLTVDGFDADFAATGTTTSRFSYKWTANARM